MRELSEANAAAINNDDRNQPPEAPRKVKPSPKRQRRNFAVELASLQERVSMAKTILSRVPDNAEVLAKDTLVNCVLEILGD